LTIFISKPVELKRLDYPARAKRISDRGSGKEISPPDPQEAALVAAAAKGWQLPPRLWPPFKERYIGSPAAPLLPQVIN